MLAPFCCVQLAARVLSEEEATQCRMRWQNERAMFAAELAVVYSSSSSHDDSKAREVDAMDVVPAAATKSGDSNGSRKRKHRSAAEDSDADTAALGGMAAAAGFVDVCGLELPQRQQPASISSQAGAQAQLVHTAAVDRNLEALAMGQCHNSSLLLLRLLPCIAAAGSNASALAPARGTGLQTNARLHPDPPCACFAGLCLGSPILLEGPPGSGKSALIEHIASLTGNAQGGFRCLPGCATAWQLLGA